MLLLPYASELAISSDILSIFFPLSTLQIEFRYLAHATGGYYLRCQSNNFFTILYLYLTVPSILRQNRVRNNCYESIGPAIEA